MYIYKIDKTREQEDDGKSKRPTNNTQRSVEGGLAPTSCESFCGVLHFVRVLDAQTKPKMVSPVKNLIVVFSVMTLMKNVSPEDTTVLFYVRVLFTLYFGCSIALNFYIKSLVERKHDQTVIEVPPQPAGFFGRPSSSQPTRMTVEQYDLGELSKARSSLIMNGIFLAFMHLKMKALTPVVLQSALGILRILDDAMFRIHILNQPAQGELARPFKPEPGLLSMLTGSGARNSQTSSDNRRNQAQAAEDSSSSSSEDNKPKAATESPSTSEDEDNSTQK